MQYLKSLIPIFVFALSYITYGQSHDLNAIGSGCCTDSFDTYPQGFGYQGNSWTKNTSKPYHVSRGLEGRHLSVWASHGRYFDNGKKVWKWQRPYLFCTTEDLLSQSFVYPYLIPMLERSGAVVFTPRERDLQIQESVVDNDTYSLYGSYYESGEWHTAEGSGFGLSFPTLNDTVFPFQIGTVRMATGGSDATVVCSHKYQKQGNMLCM